MLTKKNKKWGETSHLSLLSSKNIRILGNDFILM